MGNNEVLFSAHSAEAIIKVIRQVARSEKWELIARGKISVSGAVSIVFLRRLETPSIPRIERFEIRDPPGHFLRNGMDKGEKVPQ